MLDEAIYHLKVLTTNGQYFGVKRCSKNEDIIDVYVLLGRLLDKKSFKQSTKYDTKFLKKSLFLDNDIKVPTG